MRKKNLLVFTGAGISAESGIKTFRDSGGLWEQYKVEDVATYEAWENNRELVLDFYNQRRKQAMEAKPNEAHLFVAELQKDFDVQVVTQNVDDLHERAGSKKVVHLHGEIIKARSTIDDKLIYPLKTWELKKGDLCEKGSQLRPHIVWFGELVPQMQYAYALAEMTDLFVVIGTSLNVYPAAGIIDFVPKGAHKWLIDPGKFNFDVFIEIKHIRNTAVQGIKELQRDLMRFK